MSLNSLTTSQVIRKHVKWKSAAYSQSLLTLIIIQICMSLLGWNGSGMSGGGSNQIMVYIHYYSLDGVIMLTCIWIFVTSLLLQGKAQHQDDYSVITNRFITNVSNSIMTIIYSFVATIIATMTYYSFTLFIQLFSRVDLIRDELVINPIHLIMIFLIVLLFGASGFFIGTSFHLSKLFGVGIIVVFFIVMYRLPQQLATIINFLFDGGDVFFMLKAVILSLILFGLSVFMLNRIEVTRR